MVKPGQSLALGVNAMDAQFVIQLVMGVLTAGAIYGGIRQDIRGIHATIRELSKSNKRAHKRIDRIFDERKEVKP